MTQLDNTHEEGATFCAVHPDRETGLRCISCNRLMCVECAVRTPVGYRCKECVRGQESKFFTANSADDIVTFAVCAVLTGIAAAVLGQFPFGIWIAIIAGLPLGGAISEVALRATGRRRSRYSHTIAGAAAVIGGLAGAGLTVIIRYNSAVAEALRQMGGAAGNINIPPISLDVIVSGIFSDIGTLILIGLIAFAVYGRYRMKL